MANKRFFLSLFTTLMLLPALAAPLHADETMTPRAFEKELNAFKQSGHSRYAPQTTSRVEAYLGSAMLTAHQQKHEESAEALKMAAVTLSEARLTAAGFRKQYNALLELRKETQSVVNIVASSPEIGNNLVSRQQMDQADQLLDLVISTREAGELNKTQEYAAQADEAYNRAMNSALPQLSELAARALASAAASSAAKYAPTTYGAAKAKMAVLRSYIDGMSSTMPSQPADAYKLAIEAKELCLQVKAWRKKTGSHEDNAIKYREFRQQLATVLDLEPENNVLLVNYSNKELVTAVEKLKNQLSSERKARVEDAKRLKLQYGEQLQSRLQAQTEEMQQAQHARITDMKEVFRAKLERETFDKKQQARLRSQFEKGDADILVNLDGSLLIRLTGLQFVPARSKIDAKYQPLLKRLHAALEVYADRNVRIEGHTDNVGDVKPNQQLSLKRAESVRDVLIAEGTDGGRLKALGYGEVRPIASNDFPQGRAMNRRIDIVIDAAKQAAEPTH
ncbi:OmpA family protein [Mariprofundus sp. KV]|uniref:OmpA family protein n=1 Tax=Mariprofundus sp. KV TaxID=2608715 RepID=UPI0015A08234|nr:OmpA family protein [Mariprofundus sp. KV]NWF37113.1 OmpA family protein [Mariprofundus sp. KV]